jgi:penicillin-binding protein 1B
MARANGGGGKAGTRRKGARGSATARSSTASRAWAAARWCAAGVGAVFRRLGWRRSLIGAGLLAVFCAGFYLAQVYTEISQLIAERRAGLSSAIYSAPLAITPGERIAPLHLIDRLDHLSYSRVDNVAHPGQYSLTPGSMTLFVRDFSDGVHGHVAQLAHISFANSAVAAITDSFGAPLGQLEIEPEVIGRLAPDAPAERVEVSLDEVRPYLIKGLLATEDRFFYYHFGFDPIRIVEAAVVDFHSHHLRQGASTLTQQLARTFIDQHQRTFRRKFRELAVALVLEIRLTKNEILERYINDVPMGAYDGAPIYGMPLAARYFFNKDLSEVSPAEAATLIGMIQAPTLYDPRRHPEAARARRDTVLALMRRAGAIDDAQYAQAIATPVATVKAPGLRRAPYFTDYVIQQLHRIAPDIAIRPGLKVYTTLDPELEQAARESLQRNLARLERLHPALARRDRRDPLESAIVALDPRTGGILAMVGGRDYARSQFNRAVEAERQPGSAFKPIVYITALDPMLNPLPQPVTLASLLPDRPMSFGGWTPANYERTYQGEVTIAEALAESLNVPTVYLGSLLGPGRVIRTAHELGIESKLPDYLPVTIGAGEVNLLELTSVYQVFADGGVERPPWAISAIVGGDGRLLWRHEDRSARLMSRAVAYLMTGALQGVFQYGTAASARSLGLDFVAAGKTGTTDDYRDAFFVGYTRQIVAGVWVGFDQPETLGLTGAQAALPSWVNFMTAVVTRPELGFGPPPPGIVMAAIDPQSGGLATPNCPRVQNLPFLEGTEPTQPCPLHNGAAPPPTTTASAAPTPGGVTPASASAPASAATPASGAASNSVFGSIGNFFGSLFGH